MRTLLIFVVAAGLVVIGFSNNIAPTTYINEYVKRCSEERGWRNCYGKELSELTKKSDIRYVLDVLKALQQKDPKTKDCHILAHTIALAQIAKNPSPDQDFIKIIDVTSCNYGFVHGTIEGLSRYYSDFEINAKNIPKICHIFKKSIMSKNTEKGCAHIMGHLLLASECNEKIENGIKKAVGICSALPSDYQHECYAGIFMESYTRDNLEVHCNTPHIAWDELAAQNEEKICLSYSGDAARACWQEISHLYSALSPYNPDFVFKRCSIAPLLEQTVECYIHAAVTEIIYKQDADRKYFASICAPLINYESYYMRCITGVTNSIIYASIRFADRAIEFCKSLEEKYQDGCFNSLTRFLIEKAESSERNEVCKNLPEPNKSLCVN